MDNYYPEPLPMSLQPELQEYLVRELRRISDTTGNIEEVITDGSTALSAALALKAPLTAREENLVTNGNMNISQENGNTASGTTIYYIADEWKSVVNSAPGVASFQRVQVTTPRGSVNRLRATVTTIDTSITALEFLGFFTSIEGVRIPDLEWGTADAKPLIIRFGFKGPAGIYAVAVRNGVADRSMVRTFTISAGNANVDVEVILIFPGDTGGTWTKDTSVGIHINFQLAAGSTYLTAADVWTSGNFVGATGMSNGFGALSAFELYDVGVYADIGNSGIAPVWRVPQHDIERLKCERYYYKFDGRIVLTGWAGVASETLLYSLALPAKMRVTPTCTVTSGSPTNTTGMTVAATGGSSIEIRVVATAIGHTGAVGDPVIADARM